MNVVVFLAGSRRRVVIGRPVDEVLDFCDGRRAVPASRHQDQASRRTTSKLRAVDGTLDDGRVRARLAAPTALRIAQHLAGWGAVVEVVEPASVRVELARIGSELAKRYPA